MKMLLLYRPNSEHARTVEEFVREFERRDASRRLDLVDIDSREGAATASLYDVMDHPTILILADDGQVIQMWSGSQLPLMDEVAAYSAGTSSMLVAPNQ